MNCNELRGIYLHITEACEYHCDFCYASFGLGNFGHADYENIKKIALCAAKAGVKKISLIGGNPALHPQIAEILRFIHSSTEMEVVLMTNTAYFPNNTIKDLAPYINIVMVTIHGDNSTLHDKITTVDGSYENLLSACKEFQRYSVPIEVAYNITPCTYNQIFSSLEALINKGINVKRYVLQRIAPIIDMNGNIQKSNEEYIPNKKQVNIALSQIMEAKRVYNIPIELVDPFPLCIVDDQYRQLITPCKCGLTDLSINGKGDVSRCGADPNYQLGNVLLSQSDNPILDLWQNSPNLLQFRERKYLPDNCQTCKDKWICGGGCEVSCNIFKKYDINHLDIFNREFYEDKAQLPV